MRDNSRQVAACAIVMLLSMAPSVAWAQQAANATNYDEVYARYLAAARRSNTTGHSLWMNDLNSDLRARRVNDLVTIRVEESLSASGSADSNVGKSGSASATFPGKIGTILSKGLPAGTDTKFKGSGGTTRTTELSAVMTARVTEVLPSGDLVVEGLREVDINGDRNVVVLSGVIRTVDIQPGNVIPSTMVGQLRIRSLSAGLVHDSLEPGWLIKILNKVF
ncbi:MAG: flagellar basal body L-ring protein FlgH [Acidobacteriota bacterium]